jgi:hypothetical protein
MSGGDIAPSTSSNGSNNNDGVPSIPASAPKVELGMAELAQHLKVVTRLRTMPGNVSFRTSVIAAQHFIDWHVWYGMYR